MKRQDLLTKEEFIATRINQKFANAENRIKYYNNKANQFRHSIDYIKKPLENNIKILNKLMMDKSEMVFHKQYLLGKGFSMNNMSHIEFFENKNQFAIHKYIIISMSNEQIKIIKYNK